MDASSFGPVEIWQSMGSVGHAVLIFLLLMSTYSIAIIIERYVHFTMARKQSIRFVQIAKQFLHTGDIEGLLEAAKAHTRSHLACVYAAAIDDWLDDPTNPEPPAGFEQTMARAVDRAAIHAVQDFKRGLSWLATIGATAPFVGLFGTVVGIMNAFFAMGRTGQGGVATVAGGIAEALVNTAVGLFVALPAVWGFNYFLNRVEHFNAEMANSGTALVDYFVKHSGGRHGSHRSSFAQERHQRHAPRGRDAGDAHHLHACDAVAPEGRERVLAESA